MDFTQLVRTCTGDPGRVPYDYQRRIAEHGLPEVLHAPTGSGKTLAMVLGWLYRRRFHPDAAVRAETPRWLVFCLPMRTLVEQVERQVTGWLENSGLTDVRMHVFMGGEPAKRKEWRVTAADDAVVIGTQDMLLSRALNRGFGSSRFAWPLEFGTLHSGTWWVFDEIQLMGVGVPTGRQLQAFRDRPDWRPPLSTGSTWMSATVDLDILDTIDNPARAIEPLILSAADREGDLGTRLQGRKRVSELVLPPDAKARAKAIAAAVRARHRPGSLSLVVVNTVDAARSVYDSLVGLRPAADLLLLHSRFRPEDRDRLVDCLMQQPGNDGRIVVSTQVVEAGVDLDAALLLTEACPWASFVQRSGRCNRAGLTADAEVLWFAPAKPDAPLPYSAGAVAATIAELRDIEGETIVPDGLGDRLPPVERPLLPVLRRRDLVNLFDTTPDLMGADIDVSPFVRDVSDDASVLVAWRDLDTTETREMGPRPRRPELCPVPIGEFRRWAKSRDAAIRRYDPARREWVRLSAEAVSPAMLVVVDRSAGGYEPDRGWDPALTGVVPEPTPEGLEDVADIGDATEDLDDDTPSFGARRDGAHIWVTLDTHLRDTEAAALALLDRIGGDLDLGTRAAVQASARLHDIGKAHEEFQRTLLRGADDRSEVRSAGLLAKSPHSQHRHARPGFRHELASALALLADSAPALGTVPTELQFLAVYLTAAHHGRIRMSLRSGPGDPPDRVLGIGEGDHLPEVTIGSQVVPDSDLHPLMIGGAGTGGVDRGDEPWHEQAQQLLARFGPFRLAYLEALVRFADYRATVDPSEVIPQ